MRLITGVLLFFCLSVVYAGAGDIEVSGLAIKVISEEYGMMSVGLKVNVYNHGSPGKLYITVQGLDAEGFEILSHVFDSYIGASEKKTLSDNRTFRKENFNKVIEWRIKSIEKY
ncbi:MAG: hypothetical protein HY805_00565 [Nitrospirae bacterium]|nr:hypothetical protein [Nitrospirota bacterium]